MIKTFRLKWQIIRTVISSKKYMLITGSGKRIDILTNYTEQEIARSGNAIYIL